MVYQKLDISYISKLAKSKFEFAKIDQNTDEQVRQDFF